MSRKNDNPEQTPEEFLEHFEQWCRERNLSTGYVCQQAAGNTRLFEQMKRKQSRTHRQIARLRNYMEMRDKASAQLAG